MDIAMVLAILWVGTFTVWTIGKRIVCGPEHSPYDHTGFPADPDKEDQGLAIFIGLVIVAAILTIVT